MLRFRFTAEDLLRVRFAAAPAPLLELGLAVAALRRDDAVFTRWARRTRLPRAAAPLFELIPPSALGPLFLDPVTESLDAGVDAVLSTPVGLARAELAQRCHPSAFPRRLADRDGEAWAVLGDALRAAHHAVFDRHAACVHASFDADLAWRRTLAAEHGIGAALASLFPGSCWEGSTLLIDDPKDVDLTTGGAAVTLMPSLFWTGHPMFNRTPDGGMLLVYPALTPFPLTDPEPGDPLRDLLGRTRAAALARLVGPHTTSELAAALRVSPATASVHARTLRAAGLVTTFRTGKSVRHTTTALGRALLSRTP